MRRERADRKRAQRTRETRRDNYTKYYAERLPATVPENAAAQAPDPADAVPHTNQDTAVWGGTAPGPAETLSFAWQQNSATTPATVEPCCQSKNPLRTSCARGRGALGADKEGTAAQTARSSEY